MRKAMEDVVSAAVEALRVAAGTANATLSDVAVSDFRRSVAAALPHLVGVVASEAVGEAVGAEVAADEAEAEAAQAARHIL